MDMDRAALDDFRRYLYASWCQACRSNPPDGRGSKNAARAVVQERTVLQHLCDQQRNIVFGLGDSRDEIGFISDTTGLWVRNQYLGAIPGTKLTPESLIRFFHRKRTIYARLKRFFETQRIGRSLDPNQFMDSDQQFLRRLGWNGARLKYRGRVLVGGKDATTWIGISTIDDHSFPDPVTVANRFLAPLRICGAPQVATVRWLDAELPLHEREFVLEAGSQLLEAMLLAGTIPSAAICMTIPVAAGEKVGAKIEEMVTSRASDFAPPRRECWICTNALASDVEAALREAFRKITYQEPFTITVLDREQLSAYLSRYPWAWAGQTLSRFGFAAFPDEERFTRHARIEILTDAEGTIVHPAVEHIDGKDNVLLVGDRGAGTTTVIYHLLHRHQAGQPVIVIDTGKAHPHVAEMVEAIAVELFARQVAVVVEHMERDLPIPPAQTSFAQVVRVLGKDGYWFIVACAAAQQRATRAYFGDILRRGFPGAVILTAPRAFLERIARASVAFLPPPPQDEQSKRLLKAIEDSHGRSEEEEWKRAIDALMEWDATPGAARWLFSREPPLGVPMLTRRARRRSSYREEYGAEAELLLQLLFAAHACWVEVTTVPLMRWYFDAFGGGSEAAFHRALLQLTEQLRVRLDGSRISIKTAEFNAASLGLEINGQLSPLLISFAQKTLVAPVDESDLQPSLVRCIELLSFVGDIANTTDAIERLRADRPTFYAEWRHEIACALAVVGLPDDAMTLLDVLPKRGPWEKVISVFCQKNDRERARAAIWRGTERISDPEEQADFVSFVGGMFLNYGWREEAQQTVTWLREHDKYDSGRERLFDEHTGTDREMMATWWRLFVWHPPSLD